ncbi:MAG TPA: hypothetical protein VK154_10415 [Chitinophagales bacterium]|nr:hypothetical protein [Chitinophagales bacterium]
MRKHVFLFLLGLVSVGSLFAQGKLRNIDPRDYQYKHEASGGLRIQTNGFTLFGEYGWIKDINRTRLLQVEYSYYVDYKQKKQDSQLQGGRDYVFGLRNRFHVIRAAYGFKRTIADKAARNGVRLSAIFFGGVSLGLLKPYYLNLVQPVNDSLAPAIKPEQYSEANADRFLNKAYIVEAAPIRYGLSKMQPVAGLHVKSGLDFDWGTKDEFVKALEAGIMMDFYYKRLPIMANSSNRFYQFAFYLSFQFGKRW